MHDAPENPNGNPNNLEFVYQLRDAVTRYLAAVDAWERKYGQSYRLASRGRQGNKDLGAELEEYREARGKLEALVPRARLLYHASGIRDPFNALLRVNLGAAAPQSGTRAAIGGNERTDVARGLVALIAACAPFGEPRREEVEAKPASALSRILDFFR